jgi:hypothetical protein
MFGNPKSNPINNAKMQSPNPIPRPLVPKNIINKNKKAPMPD